jgi:hypothetical protein
MPVTFDVLGNTWTDSIHLVAANVSSRHVILLDLICAD